MKVMALLKRPFEDWRDLQSASHTGGTMHTKNTQTHTHTHCCSAALGASEET